MKRNIDALLRGRGQTRRDLARWCRRGDAWIAKIMKEDHREFPMKYFDRIADFFGIATYQLLQPGISPLTERRTGKDRRQSQERRISARFTDLSATPRRGARLSAEDERILEDLHALPVEKFQHVKSWIAVAKFGPRHSTAPDTAPPDEPNPEVLAPIGTPPSTRAAPFRQKTPKAAPTPK